MRIEGTLQRGLRGVVKYSHPIWLLLSKANHLRSEMSNFCQNLQTYIMYEVLEGAWDTFQTALDKVCSTKHSSVYIPALTHPLETFISPVMQCLQLELTFVFQSIQ